VSCNDTLHLVDVPEELLRQEEREQLSFHLATCPSCSAVHQQLHDSVSTFQLAQDTKPSPGAWTRFHQELTALQAAQPLPGWQTPPLQPTARETAPGSESVQNSGRMTRSTRAPLTAQATSGARGLPEVSIVGEAGASKANPAPRRNRLFQTVARGMAASALVMGLAIMSLKSLPYGPTGSAVSSEFTTKGTFQPVVDLQTTTEHVAEHNGKVSLIPTENGSPVGVGDGLLFRFNVQGGAHLLLIERTPEHHLSVIFRRPDLNPDLDGGVNLEITGDNGQLLRYVPSGPAGEYTYLAVLSKRPLKVTAAELDALWNRYAELKLAPLGSTPATDLSIDSLEVEFDPTFHHEDAAHRATDEGTK